MGLTRQPPAMERSTPAAPLSAAPAPDLLQPYGNAAMQEQLQGGAPSPDLDGPKLGGPGAAPPPVADVLSLREDEHDNLDGESVRALQARLQELNYPVEPSGELDASTRAALRQFQVEHADEIQQAVDDARDPAFNIQEATYTSGERASAQTIRDMNRGTANPLERDESGAVVNASGEIRANDATHQVLASTWLGAGGSEGRRRINGALMTESETFEYLSGQMNANSLPYEEGRVNVLGARGLQGGDRHDNEGVFTNENTFNDTFFVMNRDQEGRGHVQLFRGTVDPGGSGNTGFQVHDGQQWDYRLAGMRASNKYNRPSLSPQMRRDGRNNVLDPSRGEGPQDSLRVLVHDGKERTQRENFAMHSGGGGRDPGDITGGDSTGCQVVHGAWYGHYINTLRRGMDQNPEDGRLPGSGRIRYTLLNAEDMARPDTRPPPPRGCALPGD